MLKYLKLYENHSEYEIEEENLILPNVSFCKDQPSVVHYNAYKAKTIGTFVVFNPNHPIQLYNEGIVGSDIFEKIEIDGVEISLEELDAAGGEYQLSEGEHSVVYTYKESTNIPNYAFYGCSRLTGITIPNNVTSIGEGAFATCNNLTRVTIENGVTSIGDMAFKNCSSLTSVTIPDSVTTIGRGAFIECSSLTNVTIPNGVTSIGSGAFAMCSSLTNLTIGSSVTSIGSEAFEETPWWTSYSADTSNQYGNIIYINDVAYKAVSTSITSATFKNNTVSISPNAFAQCTSLTSIVIPNSVTSIGYNAFSGCSGLTNITCNATMPPTLGNDAFLTTNNCPIYVPSASVNTYKEASGWSKYASRIQAMS